MGFNGLIMTDCMEMKAIDTYFGTENAAVMAVEAGVDLVFISHTLEKQVNAYNNLLNAVKSGKISEERIDESVSRIMSLKNTLEVDEFLNSGFEEIEAVLNNETHKEFAQKISEHSITLVKNEQMLPLKSTEKILTVSTNAISTTGADDSLSERSIAKVIGKNFENFYNEVIDIKPTAGQVEHIKQIAGGYDKVIIFTYNAHLYKEQSELVRKIHETNKNVIVIAMRNPYDIKAFNYVPCYAAAYEYTPISLNSLIKLLRGNIKGSGKLPVSL
jgi:beta-N-acetylhexosaminidase